MRIGVLAAIICALLTPAIAKAQDNSPPVSERPYDGTGSRYEPLPGAQPYDFKKAQENAAKAVALRDCLQKRVGKGDSTAMVSLAALLEQGDDFDHKPDRAAALDLFEKGGDAKNRVGRERMCIAYLLGEGRPVNHSKALNDYCYPLNDDDATKIYASAYDYEHGLSTPKDDNAALSLYIDAAKAGSGEAMNTIGNRALGMNKPDVARSWFRQGAYLGNADAMDHMAVMLEAGQGGPEDKAEAYWLYVNAARRGNAHATAWVAALPPGAVPLGRTTLKEKDAYTHITETYSDKNGKTQTSTLTVPKLTAQLQGRFPTLALEDRTSGGATIACYVNGEHKIDVCLIQREFPLGYDFGRILEILFNGHLSLPAADAAGRPTANTVFALTLNWAYD